MFKLYLHLNNDNFNESDAMTFDECVKALPAWTAETLKELGATTADLYYVQIVAEDY